MRVKMYFMNGEVIEGNITEHKVVVPILLKEYCGFQHSLVITINPDSKDYHQIKKAARKGNESMTFVKTSMTLIGKPNELSGWRIDKTVVTDSMMELFAGQWANRLDAFVRTYCMTSGLEGRAFETNLGETFFIQDGIIANSKDCVIHAFGECRIIEDTLENVIIYFHGD